MANYKVYLSSTFRDLEEHRKSILDLFRYISDDFLITAMEGYTAEDTSALKKCIADVEKCDIYILLLANRYGHIPKNNELNQNPHNKSITEIEYDTAILNKKRVLVYLADVNNAEGIKFIEDDDGEDKEYKRQMQHKFRNTLSEKHLSPRAFVTSEMLCKLVSASVIKLVLGEPLLKDKKLNENLKYCCDRSEQFDFYEQNMISGSSLFHVFVTNGHEYDSGGNLANRCAIFSLNLAETDILPISFNEFYHSDLYENNVSNFIFQLHKKIVAPQNILNSSIPELKTAIRQKSSGNIVVRIDCYEDYLDEAKIKFLAGLFSRLNDMCSCMYDDLQKRVYFFLNIEDSFEDFISSEKTRNKLEYLNQQTASLKLNLVMLTRFKLADKTHINTWIDNYITRDHGQRDDLYDEHFKQDLPTLFRMRSAEKSIRRLFKRIRDKDPQIINILNTEI